MTRNAVVAPKTDACAACPWRTSNHGRPHPGGWYTDANRRRLWNGLRTGEAPGMTCHPTDPDNEPDKPMRADVETRECAGAWLLMMREMKALEASTGLASYRKGRRLSLTLAGFGRLIEAILPPPLGRGLQGTTLNEDPDISIGLGTGR